MVLAKIPTRWGLIRGHPHSPLFCRVLACGKCERVTGRSWSILLVTCKKPSWMGSTYARDDTTVQSAHWKS